MVKKIGVVGLGYVGLPVAVAFGTKMPVVGFDVNGTRIKELKEHIDKTGEVSKIDISQADIYFTDEAENLQQCDFIIVTVPTPIDETKQPDLTFVIKSSEAVGKNMKEGTIIVFESTVYPGVTEDICLPILERFSGLTGGKDFFVGYSPERINPGDKVYRFENIVKVVAGQDEKTLDTIADTYAKVVTAGVFKASSIKVAEAAKVIENTQRDLNIALMNELAIIFDKLDIDTAEVLEAAKTKWNFLPFTPGLVGGHCIGVDPYYLTYKAESIKYFPQVILAGRRINDNMGEYIARALVKEMIKKEVLVQEAMVTVLGLTFKENVSDLRNSKVIDVINELKDFGIKVQVSDPRAYKEEVQDEYGLDLLPEKELEPADAVVLAVSHQEYVEKGWPGIASFLKEGNGVVVDVKNILDKATCPENVVLWRL